MTEKTKHHYAGLRRPITDETRAGVIEDFPEIELVPDKALGKRCVEAWSYSLCCSDFHRIRDIPPWGNPNGPILRKGNQTRSEEHTSELQSRPHLVCRPL